MPRRRISHNFLAKYESKWIHENSLYSSIFSGSKGCWTSDISEKSPIEPQVLGKFGVNNETVEILAPVLANTHPKAQTETCVINPCEDFLSSEKSNSVILGGKEKCLTAMLKLIALIILLYVAS